MKKLFSLIILILFCLTLPACTVMNTEKPQTSRAETSAPSVGEKTTAGEIITVIESSSEPASENETTTAPALSSAPPSSFKSSSNSSSTKSSSNSTKKNVTTTKKPSLPGSASLKRGMTDAQYAEAYAVANEIVNKHKNKSETDMLTCIMKDIYEIYASGTHNEKDPHYGDVYGALILRRASCAGVTRAVCLCMTILNIPYEHVNESQWTHQWCRVFVKSQNEYWVIDGQGCYAGPEPEPYRHPYIFYDD